MNAFYFKTEDDAERWETIQNKAVCGNIILVCV